MPLTQSRQEALEQIDRMRANKACMAIFCTASHWNTEAVLKAASDFATRHEIKDIPVAVAITYNYRHMSQARRVTYSQDPKTGFLAIMDYLRRLCNDEDSPYRNVRVLAHLDHANPVDDQWALTEGIDYLASVMFDAQNYPLEENIALTKAYAEKHSARVLVEGIMEELSVPGNIKDHRGDDYIAKATGYVKRTGVDFLVADLGTEQQSSGVGKAVYLKQRARDLTLALGKPKLVLHGTSCLADEQIRSLSEDGIIRMNMWTRIAREAGQYAAQKLMERAVRLFAGDFEAAESNQYLRDSVEKSAQIMTKTMELLQYGNLR